MLPSKVTAVIKNVMEGYLQDRTGWNKSWALSG